MKSKIMHMFFPGKNVSPFDVNMIVDAGYTTVVPYTSLEAGDVTGLTQDCIYSRPPGSAGHTGLFIGGFDVNLAEDMYKQARASMQPPFEASILVDPNGAYTTSAALVAMITHHIEAQGQDLSGSKVTVFGGGPVGNCAAVLAAQAGASVCIARLTPGSDEKRKQVDDFLNRYAVTAQQLDAQTDEGKLTALQGTDVIICSAKAGVEILSKDVMSGCHAKVAADVNAVPPAGIAGVGLQDAGVALPYHKTCLGIGALAIGNLKYKTQQALLRQMQDGGVQHLGMEETLQMAKSLVGS